MKLPRLMDADDWVTAGKLVIFYAMTAGALLVGAAIVGLAWLVFRVVAGVV